MNDERVSWLEQEVQDLLDAGPVGLYEFISLQRLRWTAEPLQSYRQVAAAALKRILADGAVQLVRFKWPWEPQAYVPATTFPQGEDWADPNEHGLYLALGTVAESSD